jgi:hypothetical protein
LIISNTEGSIGNQIKKYQFAHRTLQEYFAAMFIVKWESEWIRNKIEYEKVRELWMWKENASIYSADELSKFIIEILLAKRDSKHIQSIEQYLIEIKNISFEIHSNDVDESWKQINYINDILQKCPNIRKIWILPSNKISIDEPINLNFLSLKHDIELDISNVEFTDNDSSMICINGKIQQINIEFNSCKYSYGRLKSFANYINQNSQLFNKIEFTDVSDNDIFDAVLMNTKFDHIAIEQDGSDKYLIANRTYSNILI